MLRKIFYHFYDYNKAPVNLLSNIILAVVLIILGLTTKLNAGSLSVLLELLVLPYKLISQALKVLALAGTFGNIIALILFVFISALPLILYGLNLWKNKRSGTIISCVFYTGISVLNGIIIYYLINPGLIKTPADDFPLPAEELADFLKDYRKVIILGVVFLVVLLVLLYLVERFILTAKNKRLNLFQASKILILIQRLSYTFLFVYSFYFLPIVIKNEFASLTGPKTHQVVLIIIQYLFTYFTTALIFQILRNLHDLLQNFTQELLFVKDNVKLLKHSSKLTLIYLIIDLSYQFINNAYQLVFKNQIPNINLQVNLPYTSIVMALVFYLLALVMHQSYEIYTEHSLTI